MNINLEQIQLRFDSLTQREKLMTIGTVLLMTWAGWDNLIYQPLQKKQRTIDSEILSLKSNLATHQQLAKQLENIDHHNPNQQKLARLQQSVQDLKQQLGSGEKKFVPAPLMANALRDILKQHGNLKLLKLETMPVTSFGGGQQPAWVYRHTLSMTLQGDYFSTVNYLKALEALSWRIHWDSIDYQVKQYPLAETHIQVYTLSFDKDWLGA